MIHCLVNNVARDLQCLINWGPEVRSYRDCFYGWAAGARGGGRWTVLLVGWEGDHGIGRISKHFNYLHFLISILKNDYNIIAALYYSLKKLCRCYLNAIYFLFCTVPTFFILYSSNIFRTNDHSYQVATADESV